MFEIKIRRQIHFYDALGKKIHFYDARSSNKKFYDNINSRFEFKLIISTRSTLKFLVFKIKLVLGIKISMDYRPKRGHLSESGQDRSL